LVGRFKNFLFSITILKFTEYSIPSSLTHIENYNNNKNNYIRSRPIKSRPLNHPRTVRRQYFVIIIIIIIIIIIMGE
jgi:hypothetical protein